MHDSEAFISKGFKSTVGMVIKVKLQTNQNLGLLGKILGIIIGLEVESAAVDWPLHTTGSICRVNVLTETHVVIIGSIEGCVVDVSGSSAGLTMTRRWVFTVVARVPVSAVASVAVSLSCFCGVDVSTVVRVFIVSVTQVGKLAWRLSNVGLAKVADVIRGAFALGILVINDLFVCSVCTLTLLIVFGDAAIIA